MTHLDSSESRLPAALMESLKALPVLRGKAWTVSTLAGGITNQNYLLRTAEKTREGGEAFVLRLAGIGTERLGIDREREYAAAKTAARCGAGCEAIAHLPEHRALVVRYAPGAALAPGNLERPEVMARAVDTLRLFHGGDEVPGRFSPFRAVSDYLGLARAQGVAVPPEVDALQARLATMEAEPAASELRPCHNDLLPANLIDDGERVRLIDWEYAAMGEVWFDLGNLAENNELSEAAERVLLELYTGGPRAEDIARLRRMRFASAMREAAWGFAQVAISTLEFDFEGYARRHLERAKILSGE